MNHKKDIRIEVVTTEIADLAMMGFGSVENCRSVANALLENYENVRLNVIRCQEDLDALVLRRPDLVFAGIKYVVFSEGPITKEMDHKIWISEFLEKNGIRHTGSSRCAIELEFDKKLAKERVRNSGGHTADYFIAEPGAYQTEDRLPVGFPLFLKPRYEGDGKGIDQSSICRDMRSYTSKVKSLNAEFCQPVLAEKYLPGREFTVAILGSDDDHLSVMPIEIIPGNGTGALMGFDEKKANLEKLIPIDDPGTSEQVSGIARLAFTALEAKGFGRIDIKMDDDGVPRFLEANLLPGMRQGGSYFPLACHIHKGWDYSQVVYEMAETAMH